MPKRAIKLYIEDIKESIRRINDYVGDLNFDKFSKDNKTIDAVVRNLSIIGEAITNIPEEMKVKYSQVNWYEAVGMRNKVVHEYFGVDEEILWKTIKDDLPVFEKQIMEIII